MKNHLIVVIDDSLVIRKIIEVILNREAYLVYVFSKSRTTLLSLMHPDAQRPVLIFMDISMPKLSNYAITRYLKAKSNCTRINIVITVRHGEITYCLKAHLAGTTSYITKPCTTKTILAIVREHVGQLCHF